MARYMISVYVTLPPDLTEGDGHGTLDRATTSLQTALDTMGKSNEFPKGVEFDLDEGWDLTDEE